MSPRKSIQALKVLFFFATKKKPAPSGDEEGRMIPESKDSDVPFHGFPFRGRKAVESTCGERGSRQQVNGAVIRPVGRNRQGPVLAENLSKVMVNGWHRGDVGRFW